MADDRARSAPPPPPGASRLRDGDDAIARHRDSLSRQFPMPRAEALKPRRLPKGTLASLALCLLLGALWWDPAYRGEHHATAVGERRELALADGSKITLDADSRVSVAWRLRSRRVALEKGRAQFQVERSPWRPFHVDAGTADVRVVGTTFDVQRSGGRVEVTVVEGRVAVTPRSDATQRLLMPGYQLVVDGSSARRPVQIDVAARTGWIAGRLEFDRTPLAEALAELQRYLPEPVLLDGPGLGHLQVSGVFDSARAEEALDLLPHILPVQVVHGRGGDVRILARGQCPSCAKGDE